MTGTFKSSIEYLLVLTAILAIAVLVVVAANGLIEPTDHKQEGVIFDDL